MAEAKVAAKAKAPKPPKKQDKVIGAPNSLDDLFAYLAQHPRLYCQHPVTGQSGWRTYMGMGMAAAVQGQPAATNGMNFNKDEGGSAMIPLAVTAPDAKPPFTMGWEVNCFRLDIGDTGQVLRYWYGDKIAFAIPVVAGDDTGVLTEEIAEAAGKAASVIALEGVGPVVCVAGVAADKTPSLDELCQEKGRQAMLMVLEGEQPKINFYEPRAAPKKEEAEE